MVVSTRRRAEPAPRTPEQEQEHETALVIQGQYRRRIGETLEIVNAAGAVETVRIQGINAGDDHAEVLVVRANKRVEAIPAVTLAEQETLAAERAAAATGGASRVIRLGNSAEVTDIAGTTKKKFKMRYGAVDVSEAVEDRARDSAEEALHREKAEVSGISGFVAKIWKHNVAYEIYRQVGIARARNKILTDKNLYTNEGLQKADHQRAVAAVVDRFVEEHQNLLHQQGADGERKKKLEASPAEVAVKAKLNDLVREFAANPAMDEDELEKRKLSIFKEANELAGEAKGRGVMVADNMIEIAKAVREHAVHAGGLDNLDIDLEFVIGKAKLGARTERERSAIDKALDGMDRLTSRHGITAGIWGATRSGAAVAGAIGLTMAQMVARSNIAKLATFGGSALATGLFSWWREKGRTNREHALHERQRALGGLLRSEQTPEELTAEEIQLNRQLAATKWWQPGERANLRARIEKVRNTKQPRREAMDQFALNRVNARDLSDRGLAFLTPDGQLKPGLDPADAMRALADMEARVSIGNIEKKDLLQYSGVAEVEIERRDLDETRMVLKAALRAANANFETDYHGVYNGVLGTLTDHKDTQQKKFDEYAAKRARNAAMIAVGSGVVVGYGAHELWAWATGNETITESFGNAGRWLANYLGHPPTMPVAPTGAPVLHAFTNGAVNTPPGTELLQQADGSWALESVADHHVIAGGLHIGSDGSLNAESVRALENLGGTVTQQDVMTDHVETVTEQIGVWDWLRSHAPQVSHVHRDIWMGNDTPAPVFDFNEQGLHWGQVNGVSASGDAYTMSLSTMTAGGSWQNGLHIDPLQETANGNMRLVLTMTEGSQNHAITLIPDANGNFSIPMNSDIGRTFFTTDQSVIDAALAANPHLHHVAGEPFFLGKHAEIAMSRGIDNQGVEHLAILATHTGSGTNHGIITRDIGECVEKHLTEIRLPSHGGIFGTPQIILPPIIPVRARTPMERLATRKPGARGALPGPETSMAYGTAYGDHYGYYSGHNPESTSTVDQYRDRALEALRNDPNLDTAKREAELVDQYLQQQDPEYLEELDQMLATETPMSNGTEVIITIPAYGEEKNIERTIRQYLKVRKPETFEIVILENHPKTKARDKTGEIIERLKGEIPELQIVHLYKEFKEKPAIGLVRKYLVDAVLRRRQSAGIDHPLVVVSNDADLEDISPKYAEIISETFKNDPRLDAMASRVDFPRDTYKKLPLFHASQRLLQYMQIAFRHYILKSPELTGANTAFRVGTYAAVGGYNPRSVLGEDLEMGWMIKQARHYDASRVRYLNSAKIVTNARRPVVKMLSGVKLLDQYQDFHANEEVRNAPLEVLIKERRDFKLEEFAEEVQMTYSFYDQKRRSKGGWMDDEFVDKAFARAMGLLGVKFRLDGDRVTITDASKLSAGIEQYKDKEE